MKLDHAADATAAQKAPRLLKDGNALLLMALSGLGLLAPLLLGPYDLRVATTVCMYLALAQSWNLIGGYAGLVSIAHAAFFGTGAIAATILLINNAGIPLAVLGAMAVSLIIALLVGLPTLRLQGHYFVAATLLLSEALRSFVLNLDAFGFRGSIAVNIISYLGVAELGPAEYNRIFFYLMLALALGTMIAVLCVERTRWGFALRAMRDNEVAANALGVGTTRLKVLVFVASALMASLIGTAWAFWLGTVETNEAYNLLITFEVIVMVFLGGRGTLWGPPVGVVLVLLLNEFIGIEFAELTQIVSGLIVVLIVMFQPDGLIAIQRDGLAAFSGRRLLQNLRRYRVA
jgi:branched-chain amino acid transport system permease protein